ncbi:MAG: zf-TFIIB domain-containing protein [Candidatus Poribacteria bacterium]|nr:zf-TFIIB domain-containing protein [Candidatus Poribacteria bacterium]
MLPCPDCNNPLTQFPVEPSGADLFSCDGCQGVFLHRPGEELGRVDNATFDELVAVYGTEYPIDVDPSTVTLPDSVAEALG